MTLTREEIESKRTEKGGFTRMQLAEWGIPWPPPKGWLKKLLGEEVYDDDKDFRGDMTVVELHDLLRKVVLAVVENNHAPDLYRYPDLLAYFGAQLPDDPDTAYVLTPRQLYDATRLN